MNRQLFIDMNSFFASVEQQERPELRGKPVIVAPVNTENTCAIAASYEAKAYGVHTLTMVKDAKRLCPEIEIVGARPHLYQEYHHRIVDVLNDHFVTVKVLSVDEMACLVSRYCQGAEEERKLALRVKLDLYRQLGECMRCSIGVADNVFLAKVCSEMEKPNGLTILDESNFPQALFQLKLRDFPGIGGKMHARLLKCGIYSVKDLWEASPADLRTAWGSVGGERWWHMMRGRQDVDYDSNVREMRKSVGHSHVLPPKFRSVEGARGILLRLISRALKRLRAYDLSAKSVHLQVSFRHGGRFEEYADDQDEGSRIGINPGIENAGLHSFPRDKSVAPELIPGMRMGAEPFGRRAWMINCSLPVAANDDITWFTRLRREMGSLALPGPGYFPLKVAATFTELTSGEDANLSLFGDMHKRARVCRVMDELNARYGHVVDLASVYWLREQAPYRIAFGASLLSKAES